LIRAARVVVGAIADLAMRPFIARDVFNLPILSNCGIFIFQYFVAKRTTGLFPVILNVLGSFKHYLSTVFRNNLKGIEGKNEESSAYKSNEREHYNETAFQNNV